MEEKELEAYERGKREGKVNTLNDAVGRAHSRLDKHDIQLSALEKVMYMGLGVILLINIMPQIAIWAGR
jgi:hypothetical protein